MSMLDIKTLCIIQMSVLEWVTIADRGSDSKTCEATEDESANQKETRHGGSNIYVFYATFERRIVLQ